MGRPPTKPGKLKDGFYIEVRPRGSKTGVKLRMDSLEKMQQAAVAYGKSKDVKVMGEYKNGKPVDE